MAAPQKVPNKTELRRYLSKGMTQQQIVDAWEKDSGVRVSRSAIAMAIERNSLSSAHQRPEYTDLLPWRVAAEHRWHYDARMLRLEGRRRAGRKLTEREGTFLDRWKNELLEASAVIHYERDTEDGFFWVPRLPEHGDDLIDRSNADKGTGLDERRARKNALKDSDGNDRPMASRRPRSAGGTTGRAVAGRFPD